MITIFIDGKAHEVKDGQNMLHTALSLGYDLPYFCWHPALDSVGACRQCAVKQYRDDKDTHGRLVMACMTPATNGTRISINDAGAREFRKSVAEWLMTNHPHDCPVCDEGGECHLQDMTLMTGQNYRSFRFKKRTFRNQNLGPFINHEMNRCIACYRCVRFYNDYAGGTDFSVFAIHNDVFFGRHEDGTLENEFSGNLVEVCPTGVFTDKTFKKHFTRKWDLQSAPSVCQQCGLGCNTIAGERYGSLRRIRNRYNYDVNGYFLCDRGRYGYEFVNSEDRIRTAGIRFPGQPTIEAVSIQTALDGLLQRLKNADRIVGIGSPRASLESNYALRTLVGAERYSNGMSSTESRLTSKILDIIRKGPMRSASLNDVEESDAVFVLGEDVTNTAPRVALSIRQAVRHQPKADAAKIGIPEWNDAAIRELQQKKSGPLFLAAVAGTRLDDLATKTVFASPDEIARLGFAVAHELNPASPVVDGLDESTTRLSKEIAVALKQAHRPLVVAGTGLLSESIIEAAANVAMALCNGERTANICYCVPEVNALGVALFGGKSLEDLVALAAAGSIDTAVVVENDLFRRMPGDQADRFLNAVRHLIVIDHLGNDTTAHAEILLPAATFAEGTGTVVNNEGRAQRFFGVIPPQDDIRESWGWLKDVIVESGYGKSQEWQSLDGILRRMTTEIPALANARDAAPGSDFRIDHQKIPRATHRYSGRTAMVANINVSEPKPPEDPETPFSYTMEGFPGKPPAPLTPFFWSPGWNSVQSTNKYQVEVAGPTRGGDAGIRLIEPPQAVTTTYFDKVPSSFERRKGEWLIVPLYHIFGSEELSVLTPGVAERMPAPYVALNPQEAAAMHWKEGIRIQVRIDGRTVSLPLKIVPMLAEGLLGIPAGLPGIPVIDHPGWHRFSTDTVS